MHNLDRHYMTEIVKQNFTNCLFTFRQFIKKDIIEMNITLKDKKKYIAKKIIKGLVDLIFSKKK